MLGNGGTLTTATEAVDGATPSGMGRRFLPVPAALWPPLAWEPGPVELTVASGTPVHAVGDGRVVDASTGIAGEIVIRDDDERLVHYRRLLPSSVRVHEGHRVRAGQLLGVVATVPASASPTLSFGIKSSAGQWLDVSEVLAGAADPDELLLGASPVMGDPLAAEATPTDAQSSTAPSPRVLRVEGPSDADQRLNPEQEPSGDRASDRTGERRRRRPADPRRIAAAPAMAGPSGGDGNERRGPQPAPPAPQPAPDGSADVSGGPSPSGVDPSSGASEAAMDPPERAAPATEAEAQPSPTQPRPPAAADASTTTESAGEEAEERDPQDVFRKLSGRSRRKER